jgi:hypothetical protein
MSTSLFFNLVGATTHALEIMMPFDLDIIVLRSIIIIAIWMARLMSMFDDRC